MPNIKTVPEHGTRQRYQHRTLKCRCRACCAENTKYIARYRRDVRVARNRARWTEPELPLTT